MTNLRYFSRIRDGVASGVEAVVLISTYGGAGNVSICGCTFADNRVRLLWFDVHSTAVSVRDCRFLSNTQSLLTLLQSGGSVRVQSCQFRCNRAAILSVRSLQGRLSVSDLQVSNHSSAVFFQVEHSGNSHDCSAEFSGVSITNSFSDVNASSSSILSVSACAVYAEGFSLKNTMLYARLNSQFVALFRVQRGVLHVSNSSAVNSGSAGTLLAILFSTATLSHCSFLNSTALQSVYFGLLLAEMTFIGIEVADFLEVTYANDFNLEAVYFGLSHSRMTGTNLSIFHANPFKSTAILAPRFSSFSLRNVELRNVRTSVGISTVSSSGEITSFKATGCIFTHYVYQTVSNSELAITGTEIDNSAFRQKAGGVLSLCSKSRVTLSSLTIANTRVSYLAKAKNSSLEVLGLFASKCTFSYLLRDVINSQLLVSNLQFTNSVGGLVDAYNSNVTFVHSLIESVSAPNILIRTSASVTQLSNVSMSHVAVGKVVATLQEASVITLSRLRVRSLQPLQDQGFVITGGQFTIAESEFTYFGGSLLQAHGSVVTILSSRFANGRNSVQSLISQLAYGGVVSCTNCVSISIAGVTVRNVSALCGGAISIRSDMNYSQGVLTVRHSKFEFCRAAVGGAFHIRNVHFHIDECTFNRNSAEESGGAIDVSVPANCTKSLRSLVFISNSASEGGAVKWRNAQVLLQNITVANNSAQYGLNFASYGIELSSRLTDFSHSIASGYPLHLIYELLDHYGQRVTSSHEEVLQLQSFDNISFSGYSTVVRSRGLFNFTVPEILAPPGSTQLLVARIDIEDFGAVVDTREISFRKCVPGEVGQTYRCAYCFSGYVSFYPEIGVCSQCPKHAFCYGGTNITVDSNYWRSSNDSLDLVECPMPGTCLGGSNNSCAHGYTGKLCNECSDGYYRYQMTGCEQCDEGAALYAQFIPIAAVVACFVFLVIKCSISETRLFILKTALSHTQVLSAMTAMKVNLPRSFRDFLHGLSYFSSLCITDLPLACMGVENDSVVRAILTSCLLPIFSILTAIALTLHRKRRVVICYTSSLLFFPTIAVQSFLPLITCVQGDDARRWLFTDTSQECWDSYHQRLFYALFLPSVALSVLAPMLLVMVFALYRPKVFLEYFPMWTCGYRWAPWDVVQFVFKNSLQILVCSGLSFSRIGQFSYGLIALDLLCFANVFFVSQVYSARESFWLAECSYLIVTACFSMGGLYVYKESGYSGSTLTFSILFLMLNCGFLLWCAYYLMWDFKETRFLIEHGVAEHSGSVSHRLQAESFGEAIVPNNSQCIDTPPRVLPQESI